jgi:hypothetical protein
MPTGNLTVVLADLLSQPLTRNVDIAVRRDSGPNGAGGGNIDYIFDPEGTVEAKLTAIPNRGGPGSLHTLQFSSRGYLNVSFAQFITEGEQNALQDVYMVRNPKHVKTIDAPGFSGLKDRLKDWLSAARMIAPAKEDKDLLGKSGGVLYDALGDLRKAAVLNIFAKATHTGTVGGLWQFIREPLVFRQDRCFVSVDPAIREFLADDEHYVPASNTLHDPLPGYKLSNSVKSDDPHANIQVTLQQASDGSFAADVDIDEHAGFEHWGEVLRNFFTKQRTNPYAVHELLLAADLKEHTLDPGYELVLK